MEKKSIFEILNERNVTYAVGISYGLGFRTWFIIVSSKHLNHRPKRNSPVFKLGFEENSRDDIIERELSEKEVQEFKNMRDKFKMVHRDDSGTIYELKNRSLKQEVMFERLVNSHFNLFRRLNQINNKELQSEATQKALTEAMEVNRYFADKDSPKIVQS